MSSCDTPKHFDLDLFMLAMGYDRMGLPEDDCVWSDGERTCIRREEDNPYYGRGAFLVITRTVRDDTHAQHEVASGRAWAVHGRTPAGNPGEVPLIELGYRMPWPTTFNEAFDRFDALGWFGKMPNARSQLMQTYEWEMGAYGSYPLEAQ